MLFVRRKPLTSFVGKVVFLGEALAGDVEGDGVWAVGLDDAGELGGGAGDGGVPGDAFAWGGFGGPHGGEVETGGAGVDGVEERAAFGAEKAAVGGVGFVAAEVEGVVGVFEDFDAAADAAVGAGGFE